MRRQRHGQRADDGLFERAQAEPIGLHRQRLIELAGQYDLLAASLAHSPPLAKSPHQRGARAIFGSSAPAHN